MSPFAAVGLELWSMTSDIFFDNFFITDDRNTADRWTSEGWALKKAAEGAAEVGTGFWFYLVIFLVCVCFDLSFCLLLARFGDSDAKRCRGKALAVDRLRPHCGPAHRPHHRLLLHREGLIS